MPASPSRLLIALMAITLHVMLSLPSGVCRVAEAYVPPYIRQRWKIEGYSLDDALRDIEVGAIRRKEEDFDLYYATRFIDRNAHKLYSEQDRIAMWEKAKGSWELRLAYEDSRRDLFFFPYPDFRDWAMAYIIIEDDYFGKGIARNADFSFCAMGGPSKVDFQTRRTFMDYQDFYLNGNLLPDWDLSYFMRGYARNWYSNERNRPPLAFTLIAVTDKVLVVRGSKTGGMAVFSRIPRDMRQASYGRQEWNEDTRDLWQNKQKNTPKGKRKAKREQEKAKANDNEMAKLQNQQEEAQAAQSADAKK